MEVHYKSTLLMHFYPLWESCDSPVGNFSREMRRPDQK